MCLDSSGELVIIESSIVASAGKTELTTVFHVSTELMVVVEFSNVGLAWLVPKELSVSDRGTDCGYASEFKVSTGSTGNT